MKKRNKLVVKRGELIPRYNPFDDIDSFFKPFKLFEQSLFPRFLFKDILNYKTNFTDNTLEFEIDIPGFEKNELSISVDGRILFISGKKINETERKNV